MELSILQKSPTAKIHISDVIILLSHSRVLFSVPPLNNLVTSRNIMSISHANSTIALLDSDAHDFERLFLSRSLPLGRHAIYRKTLNRVCYDLYPKKTLSVLGRKDPVNTIGNNEGSIKVLVRLLSKFEYSEVDPKKHRTLDGKCYASNVSWEFRWQSAQVNK